MIQTVRPAETYKRHYKIFGIFSVYFPYMIQSVILKQNNLKNNIFHLFLAYYTNIIQLKDTIKNIHVLMLLFKMKIL